MITADKVTEIFCIADDFCKVKNVAQLVHTRHRSVHNFLMNLLGAMAAYCFFSTKPEVNFDFELPEADGLLVLRD